MITTHFPRDPAWQLLSNPITLEEFNKTIPLKPYFSKYDFELLSHSEPVIDTRGDLDVQICCPPGFIIFCKVTKVVDSTEMNSNGIQLSQYVSITYEETKDSKTIAKCSIRFSEPGHFYVTFYAREQFIDNEINVESQTEICKYYVKCYAPSKDQEPLPVAPANHWGPVGIDRIGLIPVAHKNAVVDCNINDVVEVKFKKPVNLILCHVLTRNGMDEQQLAGCSSHREFGNEIIFTLRLPEVGRYGFHISTLHDITNEEVHLCSYLVVASVSTTTTDYIPPPPDGEQYGPSPASCNLGITSFTHPHPFIVTSDNNLQIVFGLSATKLTLWPSLMYFAPGDAVGRDVSNSVKSNFETGATGSYVTYFLYFKKPGYYQFHLEGKEKDLPSEVPSVSLYNYLIRKD